MKPVKRMKKLKKILCVLIAALTVVAAFSSCSKEITGKPSTDEIDDSVMLKLPVSKTDSFNPFYTSTDFNSRLMKLIYDSLITVEKDLSCKNLIASDIKAEGKSIRVTIRDNVYFSDGSVVKADDVVYSFSKASESDNFSVKLSGFQSAVKSGDNCVVFTLTQEDIYAVNCLDFPIVKGPETKGKNKKTSADEEYYDEEDEDEINSVPIGSGRYKYEDNSYNTLIFNERWMGEELPGVMRIQLVNLIDLSSAVASMETGNISFLFQDLSSGIYNRVNAKTTDVLMTNLVFLGLNSNSKALSKQAVRQAINLLLDRRSIVEKSFLGYAKEALTPFYPDWKELKNLFLDKTEEEESIYEASQLLDGAGYSEKDSLSMRKSDEMKLTLAVNGDNAYKLSTAEVIADCLKRAGIKVNIEKLKFDDFTQALQSVDYDMYIGEVKLPCNMSLQSFFTQEGDVSYGIDLEKSIVKSYNDFRSGKISMQKFTDYFNVYLPFIPLCYRMGVAAYTNEIKYSEECNQSDVYAGIYSWKY